MQSWACNPKYELKWEADNNPDIPDFECYVSVSVPDARMTHGIDYWRTPLQQVDPLIAITIAISITITIVIVIAIAAAAVAAAAAATTNRCRSRLTLWLPTSSMLNGRSTVRDQLCTGATIKSSSRSSIRMHRTLT